MNPPISVVIPVYNVRVYLPQCIDSLYAQTCSNMEVIFVNDGSSDDSFSICKEYAQHHPSVVLINKENGGLSDARNVGTKAATGDYIFYLDSDDWLAPNAIKSLYEFAIENDCEIVQGGFYYAYDDHMLYDNKYKEPFILDRREAMLELIKNDYVKNFAWGKLYRADIVKKHQFPKGKYYEDSYWQHLIVHECNRYGIVPTPLYYYRQRSTGISGEFSLKNLDLLHGYEERLKFVQLYYPQYTRQIVEGFWNIAYSMMTIVEKNENAEVRASFMNYWKRINQSYQDLFEKSMTIDVKYRIDQLCPCLMPVYCFYRQIVDKLSSINRYQTINI